MAKESWSTFLTSQENKLNNFPKSMIKKIVTLYESYGLDIVDMGEEEFSRLCNYYLKNPKQLEDDLKKAKIIAKKYKDSEGDD